MCILRSSFAYIRVHSRFFSLGLCSSAIGLACLAVYFESIRGSLNELVSFQLAELLVFVPGAGI